MANYSSSYTGAQIDSAVGRANSTDVTAGTVTASKAVVVDANSDISGFRNITATGQIQAATINLTGDTTIGDGDTDNITINADVNSNIIPNTDNTFDLGSATKQWKDLYVNGIGYIDQLGTDADPIAIYASSGEIDGTVIGSESAAAGTFTTLTASGDVNFDSNTLFVDASENRVGIGTDSPESILHIEGSGVDSLRFGNIGTSSNSALRISRDDTSISSGNPLGFLEFGGKDNTSNVDTAHAYISAVASGTHAAGDNPTDLTFGTTPSSSSTISERMRIDGSGNVGIGETSPDQLLHVKSSTGSARILVESVTDNAGITLDCGTDGAGSEQSTILFNENGSAKWLIGKDTGNDFYIYDYASNTTVLEILDNSVFKIAHNDNRNITLAEGGGNVGIGETSPAVPLHITGGNLRLDHTRPMIQFEETDGTADQNWQLDVAAGVFRFQTNNDAFSSAGTKVVIDQSGSVGIGTSSPDSGYKLDVAGNVVFGDGGGFDMNVDGTRWQFSLGGSEKMRIDSSGNVGIGVSPSDLLHLSASVPIIRLTDSDTNDYHRIYASNGGLYFDADKGNTVGSSKMGFGVDDTNVMNITSTGVGIGTTSPSRLLDLETTTASGSTLMSLVSATDGNCQLLFGDTSSDTQGKVLYNNDGDYMAFTANGSERMRINSSGNVLIGKTSTTYSVDGVKLTNDGVTFSRTSGTVMDVNRNGTDGNLISFYGQANFEGAISVSGSTITYGGFSGLHESSGISTSIDVGTVVSTIDELDVYSSGEKEGQDRKDHAKVKVSDSIGDKRVYGVVSRFDDDKVLVASVGIGSVKVTGSCEGGDLLESNGDGTAKVQDDDIIRSKTIGKVTIGDSDAGVKLVSCVLYCG